MIQFSALVLGKFVNKQDMDYMCTITPYLPGNKKKTVGPRPPMVIPIKH